MKFRPLLLLFLFSAAAHATVVPPSQWLTVTLSDGSPLEVRPLSLADPLSGHQTALAETRDGRYLLEFSGYWYEAQQNAAGQWLAGEPLVDGVPAATAAVLKTSAATASVSILSADAVPQRQPYRYDPQVFPAGFEQPLLVVRVAFDDQDFTYTDAEIAARFFAAQDSVRAYYLENSYDRFRLTAAQETSGTVNDGIIDIRLAGNHPDFGNRYGGDSQTLAREVLARAAAYIDEATYDANQDGWLDPNELGLVIMVAGYEQAYAGAATTHPRVWAHKATTYQAPVGDLYVGEYALFGERHQDHLATIGIFCHELGHLLLDLPDLYDATGNGLGIGRWGLMGMGGWNRVSGESGEKPAHMLAWSKAVAGFIALQPAQAGTSAISLRAVSDADDALEISLDEYRHGERLILEHRHQSGFDSGLPGSGVLVSRVNDRSGFGSLSVSGSSVLLKIEEADGRDDLASNINYGEASDVYRSLSSEMQFSAAAGSSSADEVDLLAVDADLVAELTLELSGTPVGSNIGLDNLPPNDVYGVYGGTASVAITLDTASQRQADGIDFYALGDGDIDFVLLDDSGNPLAAVSAVAVSAGWNRILLAEPADLSAHDQVILQLTSRAGGTYAPLAVDAQGMVSGQTRILADGISEVAAFDVSVRLLVVANQEEPVADGSDGVTEAESPLRVVSSEPATPTASSSGGGGGFFSPLWLLLASVLYGRRQRWSVSS